MEDEDVKQVYKPPEEYEEDLKEPLIDISLNESTELWLIQWPYKQVCFFLFRCSNICIIACD